MAENKKSALIYCDLIHTVKHLPDELAGRLFKHFLSYINDEDPETDDILLNIAFEPIKQQLKRDLKKYKDKKASNSLAGIEGNLKRWHNDIYIEYKKGALTLDQADKIAKDRKASPPDDTRSPPIAKIAVIDIVTDTVTDNDIDKENRERVFREEVLALSGFDLGLKEKFIRWYTSGKNKMKFEDDPYFDIPKRLLSWKETEKEKSSAEKEKDIPVIPDDKWYNSLKDVDVRKEAAKQWRESGYVPESKVSTGGGSKTLWRKAS